MTTLPDRHFLWRHPAHLIALGFGSGLAPKAPGTCGTLAALPLFLPLMALPLPGLLALLALFFVLGVWCCDITGRALGVSDHGSMVWDEMVAMWLVLAFTPPSFAGWLAAFLLFRLFDIWKPFPIRQFDARLKGGLGVMFDDLLAALYALGAMKALQWLMTRF